VNAEHLKQEIVRLGPWHHDIQVTPEVNTSVWKDAPPGTYDDSLGPVPVCDESWRNFFMEKMYSVYPTGLEGRTVLDCGCNCAECLLWAKQLGAGDCFGFDVRDHWIDQARFLLEHYELGPTDGINVTVSDIYELPKLGLSPFDITLFHGLFYHLPEPIGGLKIAADLTRELLVLNTATKTDVPERVLALGDPDPEVLLSGVHGVRWLPSGAGVLKELLSWLVFAESRVLVELRDMPREGVGRIELMASRTPGLLASVGAADGPGHARPAGGDSLTAST
jgi:tRNA (mo5U34)-methyltransferase